MSAPITISTRVKASPETAWDSFTETEHITQWCQASDDWHAPYAENDLKPGGNFVIKVFDSQNAQNYLKEQKDLFKEFHYLKPKSTRSVSKEFFVIGKNFKA